MRDSFHNLLNKRDRATQPEFLNSTTAVLGTLAVSAALCASIFTLSVTKIVPAVRMAGLEIPPSEAALPQPSLGALDVPQTAVFLAPTEELSGPERLIPAALPPVSLGAEIIVEDSPAPGLHRVIAGRPPVEAQPRPARIEALAAAQARVTTPAEIAAVRPTIRPGETNLAPDQIEVEDELLAAASTANTLTTSLRPTLRPADLEVVPTVVAAAAPAEAVTLAALPNATADTGPAFNRNANSCNSRLAREIPRRSRNADGGSEFVASIQNASGTNRDALVAREVLSGNVPDFLRDLAPVSFTGVLPNGRAAQITICVTPDYLAVGSDRDFMRVPLGLSAAGQIADAFDMMLPTTRMVDAIYAQADLRLSPSPMQPGSQMSSTSYFARHNATVETQRANAGGRIGMLVAGHKKDLVLTNRLARSPGRVAIYGWHRPGGNPIQPLSTVHGSEYADYSHGIRLVSRTAFVNGRAVDLESLLMDGTYAGLLNSEGAISRPAIQLASR